MVTVQRARVPGPPFGPGRSHPWALPVRVPAFQSNGRLNLKTATFQSLFYKVSQNQQVSPKSVHEACHNPYSQNGLQISPLEFLGFPNLLAFSHKELMGLFSLGTTFTVKMTKCRQNVHAKGSVDTPPTPQQVALGVGSSSPSARVSN